VLVNVTTRPGTPDAVLGVPARSLVMAHASPGRGHPTRVLLLFKREPTRPIVAIVHVRDLRSIAAAMVALANDLEHAAADPHPDAVSAIDATAAALEKALGA
jgi:hypothetical protein